MADNWTTISDTAVSSGQPITFEQGRAFRDNPEAIAAGNPSAPNISPAALQWQWDDVYYDSGSYGQLTSLGSGAYTWLCPAGTTAILVEGIGGGGGGAGGEGGSEGAAGAAGGSTSFDPGDGGGADLLGIGGGGGQGPVPSGGTAGGAGAAVSADVDDGTQGNDGSAGGASAGPGGDLELGLATLLKGGAAPRRGAGLGTFDTGNGMGAGGGGGNGASGKSSGGGGGAGSYGRKVYRVTPGTGYAIQIGAGGNGGAGDGGAGGAGGTHRNGSSGTSGTSGGGGGGGAGYMRIWYRIEV